MKHSLLQKRGMDAFLEQLNDPRTTNPDDRTDTEYLDHRPEGKGTELPNERQRTASDPDTITKIWKYFRTHRVGKVEEIVAFTGLPYEEVKPVLQEMGDLGYLRSHRTGEWQMLVGGKVGAAWGLMNDILGRDTPEEEVQKLIPYRNQTEHPVCPVCGGGLTRMGDPNGKTEWICTRCRYAPKGKRSAQMCEECGERPAIFKSPSTGQYKSDRYHKVCLQCWRNAMESQRAKEMAPPRAVQRPSSEQFITRAPRASKTAAKNVPDNGQYDFEHEAHVRQEAKDWAQYAEPGDNTDEIKPFDVTGNYLCGTCDMRRGTNECSRVDGPISFEKGSCRLYHKGNPETDPDMKRKFSKAEVNYGTSDQGGFGCHRCEYGGEAKAPDAKGRESWCSFWGMHIIPNACCSEQELVKIEAKEKFKPASGEITRSAGTAGPLPGTIQSRLARRLDALRIAFTESDLDQAAAYLRSGQLSRDWDALDPWVQSIITATTKVKNDIRVLAAQTPKCPECGSTEYGLMPADFETAKCDKCGKTWEIGLVKGVNAGLKTFKELWDEAEKTARQPMHDDSGATTGLRNKPDYGESTSHSSILNRLNTMGSLKHPLLQRKADWTMTCPWCKGTARKDKPQDTFKCTSCSWDSTKGEEKAKAHHAAVASDFEVKGPEDTGGEDYVLLPHSPAAYDWLATNAPTMREKIDELKATGRDFQLEVTVDPIRLPKVLNMFKEKGLTWEWPLISGKSAPKKRAPKDKKIKTPEFSEEDKLRLKGLGVIGSWRIAKFLSEKEYQEHQKRGPNGSCTCRDCTQYRKRKYSAGEQAVSIHETSRHLPPRKDMQEHMDEDVKKEIYDPLKVKREGRPVGGHTADDPAWESDLLNQEEYFNDQVADMKSEARDAFYADSDMIAEAAHQGMTMQELWQEMGNDFTNEYWQSRYGSKKGAKLAKCPKCSRFLGKDVSDHKNASVRVFECVACSHLFSL